MNRNRPHHPWIRLAAIGLLLVSLLAGAQQPQSGLKVIQLDLAGHKLDVEVAATPETRSMGLMHRRMLPENRGMLFVFPEAAMHRMWMANTPIPLSVAYLDEGGRIMNILDMPPFTQETFAAAGEALYAIETNRGWFAQRGITAGTQVRGLPPGPGR